MTFSCGMFHPVSARVEVTIRPFIDASNHKQCYKEESVLLSLELTDCVSYTITRR